MRFISIILMMYVMVLTLIPCSDHLFESSNTQHQHKHSENQKDHQHENHDCGKDTCTPFCTCSCCGIALSAADFHIFKLEKPFESYTYQDLTHKPYPLISIFQENIWQPPRV